MIRPAILTLRSSLSIAALATCVFATGCASKMTKTECEQKDYYELGLKEGKKGANRDHFNEITQQCQEQGVTTAADKYTYGRQVGLADFCSDSRAKKDANNNVTDSVCLNEKVPPYLTAYNDELNRLRGKREADLKELQKDKAKLEAKEGKVQGDLNRLNQQKGSSPQ